MDQRIQNSIDMMSIDQTFPKLSISGNNYEFATPTGSGPG